MVKARQALRLLSLIDDDGSWVARGITVVQLGDLVDRGPSSLELLRYMHRLQDQAAQHGSRLVLLVANHEILNLQGDFRYVAPEELLQLGHLRHSHEQNKLQLSEPTAVGPEPSPAYSAGLKHWATLWQANEASATAATAAAATGSVSQEVSLRAQVAQRHQLLAVEGRGGPCATAFVHAGLTPRILHSLLTAVAEEPAAHQQGQQQQQQQGQHVGVVTAKELQRINQVAQKALARCDRQRCIEPVGDADGPLVLRMWSLLTSGQGPVWTRHQSLSGEGEVCEHLQQVLSRLGVQRLVVGHTPQETGRARLKCGGRLLLLDTGMSSGMLDSAAAAWICPGTDGLGAAAPAGGEAAAAAEEATQPGAHDQQRGYAEVLHLDFRTGASGCSSSSSDACERPLKLLTWNIERGYQLDLIIAELRRLDADVLSLQEVDIGCKRSGGRDTGREIAQALQLNYLFVCEFEELHSPLRNDRTQGGGVHGNAILTKFDYSTWSVVEHSHHPIDWSADPSEQPHSLAAKEPRRGRRLSLAADICTPQGPLRVYCCHLEVFCGILSRVWQFSNILLHAKQQQQQQEQLCAPEQQQVPHADDQQQQQQQPAAGGCCQAILGDLNTMAHSVARLSPNYCCDTMRWRSFGSSEAAWWQRHVLSVTSGAASLNKYLLQLGLPEQVAAAAVNPGFFDPFDVNDVTLDNPAYRVGPVHLMAGKLDWALLRNMRVLGRALGNDDYAASDHRWLMVQVQLLQPQPASSPTPQPSGGPSVPSL